MGMKGSDADFLPSLSLYLRFTPRPPPPPPLPSPPLRVPLRNVPVERTRTHISLPCHRHLSLVVPSVSAAPFSGDSPGKLFCIVSLSFISLFRWCFLCRCPPWFFWFPVCFVFFFVGFFFFFMLTCEFFSFFLLCLLFCFHSYFHFLFSADGSFFYIFFPSCIFIYKSFPFLVTFY